jgi:sodium transport system ATP-binding protein
MIRLTGVRKTFGSIVAVDEVSFEAPDGAITGLIGPNGAGKSTTLGVVGGLLRPDAGHAVIDGHDVRSDPAAARARLGMLPEIVGLYDRLTVREHLRYAAALCGVAGRDAGRRADEAIEWLGLGPVAGRRAGELSMGQRRRVALARALVHDPANVVLDEPTSGLDVPGAREVRQRIRRLAADGRAVVLSTHVMPEVSALCDRIVVIARGRVIAEGSPGQVLARAATPTLEEAFVALIGSEEGLH